MIHPIIPMMPKRVTAIPQPIEICLEVTDRPMSDPEQDGSDEYFNAIRFECYEE